MDSGVNQAGSAQRAGQRGFALALACLAAAVAVSVIFIDRPLSAALMHDDPRITAIAEWLTWFGRSLSYLVALGVTILVLALIAWRARDESIRRTALAWMWLAAYLFLAIALSGIANDIIKEFVGRARPLVTPQELRPFYFGYAYQSFPSGHAAVAFAIGFAGSALLPRLTWLFLPLAALVASTRIFLNVHHLGDVIASALLALVIVHLLTRAFAARHLVFAMDAAGRPRRLPLPGPSRRITPA